MSETPAHVIPAHGASPWNSGSLCSDRGPAGRQRDAPGIRHPCNPLRFCRLIAVLFLVGQLAGCTQPPPEDRVRVALSFSLYSASLLLASDGPDAEQHLELELQSHASGKQSLEALLRGEAEFATVAEFAFVGHSFEPIPARILATLTRFDVNEVVARRDRGIASPADLAGKRIGVVPGTDAEFHLHAFLLAHGVDKTEIHQVPLQAEKVREALLSGTVDAVCTWQPHTHDIKRRLGEQAVAWPAQVGQDGYWLLVAREDVLRERPEVAHRLLHAIRQAEGYLKEDPAAARVALERLTGTPVAVQEAFWDRYRFGLSLPQELLLAMEAGARWRIAGDRPGREVPNYLEFIDPGPLDAVHPVAVTLIR